MEHPTPSYLSQHAWTVIAVAAVLTGLFHGLLYGHAVGLSLVIFSLAAVAGVHALVAVTGKKGNAWAYLFLAPVLFSIAAQATFAGDSVRVVSLAVLLVSFLSFAYWFAAPAVRLEQVQGFWPMAFFLESILPLDRFSNLFEPITRGRARWRKVLLGVVLAIPFLAIFMALFIGADQLLQKTFTGAFASLFSQQTFARLFIDALVLLFLLGAGWTLVTRMMERRAPTWHASKADADATMIGTFLGLLNVLFLGFLGFQFVYFFGGEGFLQTQGLTYASYAQEGFAQLMAAALLVFVILMALYRYHALKNVAARALSGLLIIQTGIISISAIRRLFLYVDAYGLTVARYWALAVIILTMVALAVVLVASLVRLSASSLTKTLAVGMLVLVSAVNLLNVEGFVAKVNVDRFLTGSLSDIDADYLLELSSDAAPSFARVLDADETRMKNVFGSTQLYTRERFLGRLEHRLEALQLQSQDWRGMVISDYRALGVLGAALR